MPRKPLHTENPGITITDEDTPGLPGMKEAADQYALAVEEASAAARAVAAQLGYDGPLTVGALEDGIRLYQRQTVQACLELGKRLLVLKEISPHGEFEQRLGLLGFAQSTAQRFMRAASKTAKSTNLVLLATQVKSMDAFLELVTQDDDTLKEIAKLDNIDRMSASQLRAALRESDANLEQARKRAAKLAEDNADLATRNKIKIGVDIGWADVLAPITDQIGEAGRDLTKAIGHLASCRMRIGEVLASLTEDQKTSFEAALEHLSEAYDHALDSGERRIAKERRLYGGSLEAYLPDNCDGAHREPFV